MEDERRFSLPQWLSRLFFAKYFAFKILSVKLMVAGAQKMEIFPVEAPLKCELRV